MIVVTLTRLLHRNKTEILLLSPPFPERIMMLMTIIYAQFWFNISGLLIKKMTYDYVSKEGWFWTSFVGWRIRGGNEHTVGARILEVKDDHVTPATQLVCTFYKNALGWRSKCRSSVFGEKFTMKET